jgi:competence protein ComEC
MYGLRARTKIMKTCGSPESEGSCIPTDSDTYVQISYSKPRIATGESEVEVGDIVSLTGTIKEMSFMAEDESLRQFFKKEKTFYEIKSAKISHIEKPRSLKRQLVRFRKSIEKSIADALPRPHSDLAQGLVVSGKGSMTKDLLEKFKRVGLIHIVVLSGSNVSIIAAALMSALRFLPRFIYGVVGLAGMSLFALMTGAAPPVVRSVLMSSIPLIFPIFIGAFTSPGSGDPDTRHHNPDGVSVQKNSALGFRFSGLSLLCLTGYVMCLFNPMYPLYDISFQLSFMATLGLVLYTEPIGKRLTFIPAKFGLREIISSSLGTQILVMPLLLQISGSMSTVFLVANILVLPVLPFVMLCIFLTSLASFIFPPVTASISFVSWLMLEYMLRITSIFSDLPFASIHLIDMSRHEVVLYYAIVLTLTYVISRRTSRLKKSKTAPT